jgi:hypothetical protein
MGAMSTGTTTFGFTHTLSHIILQMRKYLNYQVYSIVVAIGEESNHATQRSMHLSCEGHY